MERELPHAEVVDDEQRDGSKLQEKGLALAVDGGVGDVLEEEVSLAIEDAVALAWMTARPMA